MMTRKTISALLALMMLAGCDAEPAPLFEVEGTGKLEGLLFLDNDRDGRFDPSAGDVALPAVTVRLRERGTTQVLANGEATTNASGRFLLQNIAVGSHELAIDTEGLGEDVAFCQNPVPVNIYLNEVQFRDIAALGGCLITVAEAEARAAGSPVTVRGTVVSSPGQIVAGRMYVQDATGGIRAFNVNTGGVTLKVGDVVEISGELAINAGETEIINGQLNSIEEGTPLAPQLVTTKAIADAAPNAAAAIQGKLTVVRKAQVTTAWNQGTGSSRNAFIDDGSGRTVVRIDSGVLFVSGSVDDLLVELNKIMAVGKCYDVVGITASFNATGQLFPRTLNDITEVPCN